jgi:lipopolysaccharide export system protein LptA
VFRSKTLAAAFFVVIAPLAATAQGAQVAFGSTQQNSTLPVEVTADDLAVDQGSGSAVFTGNVTIGQGEMRLSAPRVQVKYLEDQSGIESLSATGGVTLVSGPDAAEASRADYDITTGVIRMQGDVLLVQGANSLTAETMFVDTRAGTARMSGRVKTVIQPQDGN